jgi:hypothetical protein
VHLVWRSLRPDLYEYLPTYHDVAIATKAKADLIKGLRRQGFVVNRKGHRYRIYVILLRDVGPRKRPDKPWLYVRQTAKDIEVRFREHIAGVRTDDGRPQYSRVVYRFGEKLLPNLYESIPPVYLREDALQLEKEVATRFSAEGYSVKGGH